MYMNESIVMLCLVVILSYLIVGWWMTWRHMRPSPLLPFSLTKFLASLGKNLSLDNFDSQAGGLAKLRFGDHRYQEWLEEVVDSGQTTQTVYMMFNNQRADEIKQELARREASGDGPT